MRSRIWMTLASRLKSVNYKVVFSTGTVTAMSPDAAAPPTSTATPGVPDLPHPTLGARYEVTIQSQTQFLESNEQPCHLQAGMEGSADIVTRQETVLLFFLRKARLLIRV